MNFKTTIILLILLCGLGTYLLLTRDSAKKEESAVADQHKLLNMTSADISQAAVIAADGTRTVLEKQASKWRLTAPVNAAADTFKTNELLDAILGLSSTAEVPAIGKDAPKTGLDQPQYKIELTANGKQTTLLLGNRLVISDSIYAQVAGKQKAEIVSAQTPDRTDLIDALDHAAKNVRDMRLVEIPSTSIRQVIVSSRDERVILHKIGDKWELMGPKPAPADQSTVTSLLAAITGMTATEFVDKPGMETVKNPVLTVAYSTQVPTTAPSSTAPSTPPIVSNTIKLGDYTDLLKKSIYVQLGDSSTVAEVPASVLDSLRKTPLDLRDRDVVEIDPAQVSRFSIESRMASSTKDAAMHRPPVKFVSVERRPESKGPGPLLPTTQPDASLDKSGVKFEMDEYPAVVGSPWLRTTDPKGDADQSEVTALLNALHPLHADKYLDKPPTTQPTAQYDLKVTTVGAGGAAIANYEIHLLDLGNGGPVIGEYNGLTFEMPRSSLTAFEADFVKKATPAPPIMPGRPQGLDGNNPNEPALPPGQ